MARVYPLALMGWASLVGSPSDVGRWPRQVPSAKLVDATLRK